MFEGIWVYHFQSKAIIFKFHNEILRILCNASFIGDNKAAFNIKGNKYRIVVAVNYNFRIAYICFMIVINTKVRS